ncbi:MAG TPA: outer membrane beta-barrel domain-containing protein [Oligoflexia bacterium]|nr:outer membrane beta-barrel domain-containing protein [Oligoflexia bacterium]HMR23997.1 outer membrane beta-barrel domain-containing protein [Oligoflexia bacterium]
MEKIKLQFGCLFLLACVFCVQNSIAQSFLDPETYALQNRKYHMKNEFFFSAAYLPIDAFEKGYGANFSYTYHFNDAFAIELPQFTWISSQNTGLQNDLQLLFGLEATDRDSKNYVITSNIVFKPVYRKMLFFNKKIMYGESYTVLGGGFFKLDSGFKPTADLGIGLRLYLNQKLSIKTELRNYFIFDELNPKNEPSIIIGLSFNRGGNGQKK